MKLRDPLPLDLEAFLEADPKWIRFCGTSVCFKPISATKEGIVIYGEFFSPHGIRAEKVSWQELFDKAEMLIAGGRYHLATWMNCAVYYT